ncbi:MAG: hypothetical protein GY757_38095 [bacterium]|nr:hypothetical protein [bacterium]
MNMDNSSDLASKVNSFHARIQRGEEDFFQLLGVPQSAATQKQLETAHQEKKEEFSAEKMELLEDPNVRKKILYISARLDHIFSILSDFEKRAKYEKMGNSEIDPEDLKEDDPAEIAKENYILGKSLFEQKSYQMAVSALNEAIRLDPTKGVYYLQLGLCQSKASNLKREAEKNIQTAIELEPWNAEHYAAMGMFFFKEKLNTLAESYFRAALQRDPENSIAIKGLEVVVPIEEKPIEKVMKVLKKILPSIFDRK